MIFNCRKPTIAVISCQSLCSEWPEIHARRFQINSERQTESRPARSYFPNIFFPQQSAVGRSSNRLDYLDSARLGTQRGASRNPSVFAVARRHQRDLQAARI